MIKHFLQIGQPGVLFFDEDLSGLTLNKIKVMCQAF